MRGKFVAYYRVSTQQQGYSGLGLEAQQKAVMDYLNGGKWELLKEFTEIETGKGKNALEKRPVLAEAIAYTKKNKATLIIAKLDRLARNVHFITGILESEVKFVCADMPEATTLTLQVMAAVAEYESKRISERTKEALQMVKLRGVKLGNPNLKADNKARTQKANLFAANVRQIIMALQNRGLSQRQIVEQLNQSGVKSPKGGKWYLLSLQRVIKRFEQESDHETDC